VDAKNIGDIMGQKAENHNIQLEKQGFTLLEFPLKLQKLMAKDILRTISLLIGTHGIESFEQASRFIEELDNDSFVKAFAKPNRNFSHEVCLEVEKWVQGSFSAIFPDKKLAINKLGAWETEGHPRLSYDSYSVYWRCVRGGKENDVGKAHRDSTFWDIAYKQGYDPQVSFDLGRRWKVWTPVFGCTSANSLQMVKGSNNENIDVFIKETQHGNKPFINERWLSLNEINFFSPLDGRLGQCVCFHDDMVHRGQVNNSTAIRISAEFTVITD
jgi:hypothetical protein